jgi:dipeptidyl aminopeptidase/acylaminoacyl peptidase
MRDVTTGVADVRRTLLPPLAATLVAALAFALPAAGADSAVARSNVIAFVRYTAQSGHPRIYTIDVGSHALRSLRLPAAAAAGPACSSTRRGLAFVGGLNRPNEGGVTIGDELYVAAADGPRARRLTHDPAHESGPSWAPNAKRIVFTRSAMKGNRSSLWLVGADGRGLKRLTYGAIDLEPSWSPNGAWIAFLRIDPKNYRSGVWLVRPDGSGLRRLPKFEGMSDPVWSPNGSHLVVSDGKGLFVAAPNGTRRRLIARLATSPHGERVDPQPAWSPNGRQIVFAQARASALGHSDLWIVDANGNGLRRLTRSPGLDADPSWGC